MKKNTPAVIIVTFLAVIFFYSHYALATTGTIDATDHYSILLEDGSQINWKTTNGEDVLVTDTELTGEIFGENIGWIKLDPAESGVINDGVGNLSGYAWGENAGWINFDPTEGGVQIEQSGDFAGYAWSEVYGWIQFDCDVVGACLKTDWGTASGGGGGGGGSSTSDCEDGNDNDSDGLIDYPNDPGCSSGSDNSEDDGGSWGSLSACSNGLDDDGDGYTDYPVDSGCISSEDESESNGLLCDLFPDLCAPSPDECVGADCGPTDEPPEEPCIGDDCSASPDGCIGDECNNPLDEENPIPVEEVPTEEMPGGGGTFVPIAEFFGGLNSEYSQEANGLAIKIATLFGLIVGLLGSLATVLFANPLALSELLFLPLRLWSLLLSALGLRRKARPWGTVYDAITKQPLDPAYVLLQDINGIEITSAITDFDGRYGFVAKPGMYKIVANKTNYKFPSEKMSGRTEDELYKDLYFGEMFEVKEDNEIIAKNIPLDPIAFDWNEFEKSRTKLTSFYTKYDTILVRVANIIFIIGFALSALALFISPVLWNIVIFGLYVLMGVLRSTVWKPHPFGGIFEKVSGAPISFAIVRLMSPSGNEVAHKVADQYGRYYMLVRKGIYTIAIDRKNADGSYTRAYTSPLSEIKKGYLDTSFEV